MTIWRGSFALGAPALVIALAFLVAGAPQVRGQASAPAASLAADPGPSDTSPNAAAIRSVLAELDDRQVRSLLIERLTREADREARARAAPQASLGEAITTSAGALGLLLADVVAKAPRIPGEIAAAFAAFDARRGEVGLWRFFVTFAASLAIGGAAAYGAHRAAAADGRRRTSGGGAGVLRRTGTLALRLAAQAVVVALFTLGALATNAWLNAGIEADRDTVTRIVHAIAWSWLVLVIARFLFAPRRPDLRLCRLSDVEARWLSRRFLLVGLIFSAGFGFTDWMNANGSLIRDSWPGFWVNLVGHWAVIDTIWRGRHLMLRILGVPADGAPESGGEAPPWIHAAWPRIAIGLVAANWLLIELVVATAYLPPGLFTGGAATMAVLLLLPFLDKGVGVLVAAAVVGEEKDSAALRAADAQTRKGLRRITRVVGAMALLVLVLAFWRVDPVTLAERGVGARFGADLIGALMIAGAAYALCEAVRVLTDRRIALERDALGLAEKGEGETDGEGGGAGARLGTLLPLVRASVNVAIAALASLMILGQFGVNVLPLLAGFGVVGLAVGFGAQTLVKDIVSGVFFLIDDAFRLGEYIDIGAAKGTVERISVRSMQLRHHRGVLNTVPFGDIGHVANFSRDWVVMKFPLRLPYGTDAERVRKLIKKLGQELLEHPEFGDQFLQPLKCQGLVQMEDSAMIMPVKFMSRPGEQWMLRRLVLARIHELFEEKGIRFANREVTVRLGEGMEDGRLSRQEREAVAGAAGRLAIDQAGAGDASR